MSAPGRCRATAGYIARQAFAVFPRPIDQQDGLETSIRLHRQAADGLIERLNRHALMNAHGHRHARRNALQTGVRQAGQRLTVGMLRYPA